jgi:hypothetical protein
MGRCTKPNLNDISIVNRPSAGIKLARSGEVLREGGRTDDGPPSRGRISG